METRCHIHEEEFDVSAEELFRILVTPSAIRDWWSASRVVVIPREGGTWAAAWGEDEDDPDYVATARIGALEPPRRLVFTEYEYYAREGALPFEPDFVTEFSVEPRGDGAVLRVRQDGFPATADGDEFLRGCEKGWRDTFAGIRRHLGSRKD